MSTRTFLPTRKVPADPVLEPTQTLPRAPVPGVVPAVVLVLAMVAVTMMNAQMRLVGSLAVPWVVVVVVCALLVVYGHRTHLRRSQLDVATEAVLPLLGARRPSRDLVRATAWSGGWVGVPQTVKVRFVPEMRDHDPARGIEEIRARMSLRLGFEYRIVAHDPRRCFVVLERGEGAAAPEVDPVAERLESIVSAIIPSATVGDVQRDSGGAVEKFAVRWPSSSTVRATKRVFQRQLLSSVRSALGNETMTIAFDLHRDVAVVSPLIPLPDVLPHPPRDEAHPMQVPFGRFRDGRECVWDLDAPVPHLLIVGGTGGGKTVLLLSLLTSLPRTAEIYPIDPKRLGLYNLDLIPGTRKSATSESRMVDYILEVREKMDARYSWLEKNGPHLRETLEPLILVIDEGEEMAELLNSWWKSGEGKRDWCGRFELEKPPTGQQHPVMSSLGSILRLGREARVHVILASQQAASSWVSTSSRSQFAVRIALRNLEASTSMMTFGSLVATSGLEAKPGRAWVSLGMGVVPEHAQIYWTPKLAPGLGAADRAILHGLGVALPDDGQGTPAGSAGLHALLTRTGGAASPAPAAPATGTGPVPGSSRRLHIVEDPAPAQEQSDAEDEGPDDAGSCEISAADLDEGMTILVDTEGDAVQASVESIDVDPSDEDCLVISYVTTDGEEATLTIPESETVRAVLA